MKYILITSLLISYLAQGQTDTLRLNIKELDENGQLTVGTSVPLSLASKLTMSDSATFSTRAYRQKLADSVNALLAGKQATLGFTPLNPANNLSEVTPATARTNLGATTVGSNLFTLTNPSAIRYLKINADNTVTARTAAEMLSDIGAQASGSYVPTTTTVAGFGLSGNVTLADLTATNSSLTFSGSYNGSTARTIGLNVGNANSWSAAQTFTSATPQVILGVNNTTLGSIKMFGNTSGDATIQPTSAAGTATVQTLPATTGTLVNRVTTGNGVSATNSDGALSFTLGAITPTSVNGHTFTTGSSTFTGTAAKTYTFPASTATVVGRVATAQIAATASATSTTTLFTPPADGFYRIAIYLKITTTGTSPVAGPVTITYTDALGSVAQSHVMLLQSVTGTVVTTTVNNSTTTGTVNGSMVIYAKSGVNITYAIAVSGTFGAGRYQAFITCEAL